MKHENVVKLQAAILITLGATYHSQTINYIVWEWLSFHLGYYLFPLGFLQLLKIRERREDDMETWYAIQAFCLIWISIWFFDPARNILQKMELTPSNFVSSVWGWKSWGYCLLFFGTVQLMKIKGASNVKLSLFQSLLLISWSAGFFEWSAFIREFIPPLEYYNYLLILGILEFLKTVDMDNDSIPIRSKKQNSSLDSIYSRRRTSSYGSQKSSKTAINKRTSPMFTSKKEMTTIECPGCKAQMDVPKLGKIQNVKCKKCGLSGEIEI